MGIRHAITAAAVAALLLAGADAAAPKTVDAVAVSAIAAGDDELWAWSSTYSLLRIDAATARVARRVDTVPGLITSLAVGENGVWGAGRCGRPRCGYGVLMRFDPATGRRSRPLTRLGLNPRSVATGFGSVWVLGGRRLVRVDPLTRRVAGRPIPVGRRAIDLAAGAGSLWVLRGERRGPTGATLCDLVEVSPAQGRVVRSQPVGCGARSLVVGPGGVWIAAPFGRGIVRVRPRGGRIPLPGVQLAGETSDVATGLGAVWATGVRDLRETRDGAVAGRAVLSRLDVRGRRNTRPLDVGAAWAGFPKVAVAGGVVWVANAPRGMITRIEPGDGRLARVRLPLHR